MTNASVVCVPLDPAVNDFVSQEATVLEAFQILSYADDIRAVEPREMTLQEALQIIGKISRQIEALG